MKILTVFSIALVIFAAAPVFACGGSCGGGDKGKGDKAFTLNVQTFCGGDTKGDKTDGKAALSYACNKPKPKPDPAPQCGGDKGKKSDPKPQLMCGGGSKDKDKDGPKT